ncbi:ADL016Cp [Eremothecium gossypii ATCC 10895]|uniref:Telomere replication protein EST3 n=1 Tax=Eremothecium gossypii (strain ATCC 10895 / CBS 109.51 / FGSC 9923 / NRRL Y-1056) TaxID=284811 RepID=EST3_EREGS|nr:ADL016Cp [Eremothecium gossypii ATCC 10895]Q75AD3.1 RecName: Full=Telomere replication protein EST3 [Eremothecium gossypii ATCC 10895]AAS51905.1 ADL016Cp [Eremothecium gossypii ATCC 10895]AEY96204.1 FADL016Cp [Eremothecium gossypii FDAG1]
MPKVVLASRAHKADSIFLREWLVDAVVPALERSGACAPWAGVECFIPALPPATATLSLEPTVIQNPKRFLRIVRFTRVHDFAVCAVARDAGCCILVEFTPHCVSNFERRYHQRITSSTVNSLFVIGNTSLLFYARSDAAAAFEVPALMNGSSTLPVLRVGDCAIFDQDQVESHRRFPLVQEHPRFVQSLDMAMQGSVLSRYT